MNQEKMNLFKKNLLMIEDKMNMHKQLEEYKAIVDDMTQVISNQNQLVQNRVEDNREDQIQLNQQLKREYEELKTISDQLAVQEASTQVDAPLSQEQELLQKEAAENQELKKSLQL